MKNSSLLLNKEFIDFVKTACNPLEKVILWEWIIGRYEDKYYTPEFKKYGDTQAAEALFEKMCKLLKFKVAKPIVDNSLLIKDVIEYFNKIAGTHFSPTNNETIKYINRLVKDGRTAEQMKKVIDKKIDWLDDPKMCKFFRPITLFNAKFESYLNEPEPIIQQFTNSADRKIQQSITSLYSRSRASDN